MILHSILSISMYASFLHFLINKTIFQYLLIVLKELSLNCLIVRANTNKKNRTPLSKLKKLVIRHKHKQPVYEHFCRNSGGKFIDVKFSLLFCSLYFILKKLSLPQSNKIHYIHTNIHQKGMNMHYKNPILLELLKY